MRFPKARSILVCYVYRPPNSLISWFNNFSKQLELASKNRYETILLGDFNVDLTSHSYSNERNVLQDIIQLKSYTQIIDEYTRVTASSLSLIDHIYVTNVDNVKNSSVHKMSLSDHYAISLTWKKPQNKSVGNSCIHYRDSNHFDPNNFMQDFNILMHLNDSFNDSVNVMVENMTKAFLDMLNKHAPIKSKRIRHQNQPAWFTKDIKEAILERERSKKRHKFNEYRNHRNKVVKMIKNAKSKHYHRAIPESRGNSKKLWKEMHELTGKTTKTSPMFLMIDNEICNEQNILVNELNKYFTHVADEILNELSEVLPAEQYQPPMALYNFINNKLPHGVYFSIPEVDEASIETALNKLNTNKATGTDEIGANFIKLASPVLARHLCRIINISISSGVFPSLWKHAKVFPIFKSGNKTNMNNYRPISILNILSKIIESHVHDSFYNFLSSYNLLSPQQSGVRKNHSCETGLATLLSQWHQHIDDNFMIGSINIDLRKAFDLLNHDILCKKLKLYGCSNLTVAWFKSYLSELKQSVFMNESQSDFLNISHGVPQGSILGPLLFILLINDLPLCLTNSHIHMYADDTTLYALGKDVENINQTLNDELDKVNKWFNSNNLILNAKKTNCMLICTKQKRNTLINDKLCVHINGSYIDNVTEQNVLGLIIDKSLKFDSHVNYICKKLSKLFYLFSKIRYLLTYDAKDGDQTLCTKT